MTKKIISPVAAYIIALGLIASAATVDARSFRLNMVPNAGTVDVSCNLCHTSPHDIRHNAFGLDIQQLVTPNGQEIFWGPKLAALDSDGDGVPNGVELGDPAGSWTAGADQPGEAASITHPGDAASFIETITAVGEATWASVKVMIRGQQ